MLTLPSVRCAVAFTKNHFRTSGGYARLDNRDSRAPVVKPDRTTPGVISDARQL
jgi:hypothetical protein